MKTHPPVTRNPDSHTSDVSKAGIGRRNVLLALLGGSTVLATPSASSASIGTSQTPTSMSLELSVSQGKRGSKVTAIARITRIDTGAAVRSALVTFYYGSPRFPNSKVGSKYTNADGVSAVTFTIPNASPLGRKAVLAEFTGNNLFAQPLPYSFLEVVN